VAPSIVTDVSGSVEKWSMRSLVNALEFRLPKGDSLWLPRHCLFNMVVISIQKS